MASQEPELTSAERAELERLRAENAALRVRPPAAPAPGPGAGRRRWRTIVATLLIVVGCVLAPLSVVALALIEFLGRPPEPVQPSGEEQLVSRAT